ncbi:MAG: hypothetical protein IKC93_08555, partial [Candidatus Methanomethylophilaceae archaeon]|nr:hypothetical protein [Candidatus Methanomethylophilaceae archaeon]
MSLEKCRECTRWTLKESIIIVSVTVCKIYVATSEMTFIFFTVWIVIDHSKSIDHGIAKCDIDEFVITIGKDVVLIPGHNCRAEGTQKHACNHKD